MIDAHVHFNEPGRTDWEGWATGTRALAAGGATACIEMPLNAHPPTIDGAAFDAKVAAARAAAVVDFALWGGIVPGNLDRLDELAERGVVGFKAFMCDSGIEDFPAADDDTLAAGMERAAALDLPGRRPRRGPGEPHRAAGHRLARLRRLTAGRGRAQRDRDARSQLARETGCSLHVVHVSTARGVALVAQTRARRRRHLRDLPALPHAHRRRPRARSARARSARRRCATRTSARRCGRRSATSRFVASDHSPCPPEMKQGDFTAAWGGIAGCQSLLRAPARQRAA